MARTFTILKWALLGIGILVTASFIYVSMGPMFRHYLISAQKEDPYDIAAALVFSHHAHSCISAPCDATGWQFRMTNTKPMEYFGMSLCDTSMIDRGQVLLACGGWEDGSHSLYRGSVPHYNSSEVVMPRKERLSTPANWAGGTWTCPQACKIGDNVDIKVKVAPANVKIVNGSESWSFDANQMKWIDLGESKIVDIG